MRNLLESNIENQAVVASMESRGLGDTSNLQQFGVDVVEEHGRVKIVPTKWDDFNGWSSYRRLSYRVVTTYREPVGVTFLKHVKVFEDRRKWLFNIDKLLSIYQM